MATPILSPQQALLTPPITAEVAPPGGSSSAEHFVVKPVWKKPSMAADIGPVMGAVSWPSLVESTKYSRKPSSSLNSSESPASTSQVDDETVNSSPASSSSIAPQKQMTSNPNDPNPNAAQHRGRPTRQRSMKHEGGGNSSANGAAFSHQPPLSSPVREGSLDTNGASDNLRRDYGHNNYPYRDGGLRDHLPHHNYRRCYGGPHIRGNGPLGGRRDQDRANPNWTHNRSFNGRGPVVPPQRAAPRGFMGPPMPDAGPYMYTPHNNSVGIPPGMQSQYYFPQPRMPFGRQMTPSPTVHFPTHDLQLPTKIINQIHYYFSHANLVKDEYLLQKMDKNGWVPIHLIATFNKVKQLTSNIQLILDSLQTSNVVELQGDKIRKRDGWMRYILPRYLDSPPSVDLPEPSALAARVDSAAEVDIHSSKVESSS